MWSVEAVSQEGNSSESMSSSRNPLDVNTLYMYMYIHSCILSLAFKPLLLEQKSTLTYLCVLFPFLRQGSMFQHLQCELSNVKLLLQITPQTLPYR